MCPYREALVLEQGHNLKTGIGHKSKNFCDPVEFFKDSGNFSFHGATSFPGYEIPRLNQ